MGNASSRVKKRVPRNLRKTTSFLEKAKKQESENKNREQANVKTNEHDKCQEPSSMGKCTMFFGYDSDAEVLDMKEILNGSATKTTTNKNLLERDEDTSQVRPEGDMNPWNERPVLISSDCLLQPKVNRPEGGLTESLNQQCRDSNLPVCTPQSPDLVPIRLPSLTSSVTTSQWRLSHDENPQLPEHITRPESPIRDLSLPVSSKFDEAALHYATSQTSKSTTESTSRPRSHIHFVSMACSSDEMRPSFSGTSIHLQSMRIPQHLRSMSTASINNSILDCEAACNNIIHNGTNIAFEDKKLLHRTHCASSTGFESTNIPLSWGRVEKDNASSIYSSVPQTSGRSTPNSAINVGKRSSVETVRINMQTLDESASRFNFWEEDAEATSRDPSSALEQELNNAGGNEMVAFDGGRSTPSLTAIDTKSPRQVSFALHGISVPEKQILATKKSAIQSRAYNFRARLPRSQTRFFLGKKDSISSLDGKEERRSKRSKSMYGLQSVNKEFKYLALVKKHPQDNEVSTSFSFSSPTSATKPFNEEKSPTNDEGLAFQQYKSMHQLKPKYRDNRQESITQSHLESGSWNKYPSHTRAERNGVAGPRDHVYPKDFAPQLKINNSFGGMGDQSSKKTSASKRSTKSKIAKSRSMIFGKSVLKSYAKLFKHQSIDFRRNGHGHKSSVSVSGITEYPELEMIASVFPNTSDTNSSQLDARQRSDSPDTKIVGRGPGIDGARQWSQIYQSCVELSRSSEDVSKGDSSENKVDNTIEGKFETGVWNGSVQGNRNSISSSGGSLRDSTEELAKAFQETEASECAKVMQIARNS